MLTDRNTQNGFEELAMPLFKSLYNLAHWLTRDAAEAEDLVQETYARALRGFSSFQQGTNFRAWIFRILRNAFFTSRTGLDKGPHSSVEEEGEELLPPMQGTPETHLLNTDMQDRIRHALERLPASHREVILLCDVEEMKYQEIAELMGLPIGTVMSRISRARKILRGLLAEEQMGIRR